MRQTLPRSYGAVVYPAHIDREGNGILAVLGILPEKPLFSAAEFHDAEQIAAIQAKHPGLPVKILSFAPMRTIWKIFRMPKMPLNWKMSRIAPH